MIFFLRNDASYPLFPSTFIRQYHCYWHDWNLLTVSFLSYVAGLRHCLLDFWCSALEQPQLTNVNFLCFLRVECVFEPCWTLLDLPGPHLCWSSIILIISWSIFFDCPTFGRVLEAKLKNTHSISCFLKDVFIGPSFVSKQPLYTKLKYPRCWFVGSAGASNLSSGHWDIPVFCFLSKMVLLSPAKWNEMKRVHASTREYTKRGYENLEQYLTSVAHIQ